MAKITRFEDIEAWKAARILLNQVYDLSDAGPFRRDFALRDQVRRAAISILSNIAEGFERDGNKEFLQFLSHAKGSVGELRAQFYAALDRKYIDESQFNDVYRQAAQISRLLNGFMSYLRRSDLPGRKFTSKALPET